MDTETDELDETGATQQANPKNAWNVKGLLPERRAAITQAAHRQSLSVADYVWHACEAQMRAEREPLTGNPRQTIEPPLPESGATLGANQEAQFAVLFDAVCRLAGTSVTRGNGRLASVARAALEAHLLRLCPPGTIPEPRARRRALKHEPQ